MDAFILRAVASTNQSMPVCQKIDEKTSVILVFRSTEAAREYLAESRLNSSERQYEVVHFEFSHLDALRTTSLSKKYGLEFFLKVVP